MIFIIPDSMIESYTKRLTNQMWKLIPMRENATLTAKLHPSSMPLTNSSAVPQHKETMIDAVINIKNI